MKLPLPPLRAKERGRNWVQGFSVELDGFQHGLTEHRRRDEERAKFLAAEGIEELRYWNHQWRKNREGVLLEIWKALHRRTGCVKVLRKEQNHRFVPPKPEQLMGEPKLLPRKRTSSPRPSPPAEGGEGDNARVLDRVWGNRTEATP